MNTITVDGIVTRIGKRDKEDLICVTDLARWENPANPDRVWYHYIATKRNFEFVLKCEKRFNPEFDPTYLDGFKANQHGKIAKPMEYLAMCNAKCGHQARQQWWYLCPPLYRVRLRCVHQ